MYIHAFKIFKTFRTNSFPTDTIIFTGFSFMKMMKIIFFSITHTLCNNLIIHKHKIYTSFHFTIEYPAIPLNTVVSVINYQATSRSIHSLFSTYVQCNNQI